MKKKNVAQCSKASTRGAVQLGTVVPFLSPRWGDSPASGAPTAGRTGQTVSVIPKISYRFSPTIPLLPSL